MTFGPGLYMYHAESIGHLKKLFSSGEAFAINSFFRHDLSGGKYEIEITDKYLGHDLEKIRAEHPDAIFADSYTPEKNGPIVYLACTPTIDFEAFRQEEYARIKRENAEYEERKAREAAEKAADKARKDKELAERIAKNRADEKAKKEAKTAKQDAAKTDVEAAAA